MKPLIIYLLLANTSKIDTTKQMHHHTIWRHWAWPFPTYVVDDTLSGPAYRRTRKKQMKLGFVDWIP